MPILSAKTRQFIYIVQVSAFFTFRLVTVLTTILDNIHSANLKYLHIFEKSDSNISFY